MDVSFKSGRLSDETAPTRLQAIDGIGISEQAGLIGFNRVPPDHNGAVGQDHVVSVLNHVMQIYDKSGNLLATQTLESLFGVVPTANALPVDPNILYDPFTQRFVYVSFEVAGIDPGPINAANDQIRLNIAVSQTSNPLDGWIVRSIDARTVIGGENTWSDYPGVGVDGDAIYITANMFQFDGGPDGQTSFAGNRLWIIDKGDGAGGFYDGGVLSFTKHDPVAAAGPGAVNATLIPARFANDSPGDLGMYLVATSGLSNGVNELVQVIHVTDPLGGPDFSVQTISLGDISNENLGGLPAAPQLGTSNLIGSGDARVNSGAAVWFEGKLYITSSVAPKFGPDAGQITTHWIELDATAPGAVSLLQQGNIGGEDIAPGTRTYHSSINVNKDGSVLINFSASGPNIYPGAYYAIRAADDPAGQFGPAQTLHVGIDHYFRNRLGEGISSQTTNRWGDFSGVGVDPVDGTTFWFFNQYADTRGSPNASGQDGRWRVVLGSARPTIQNFQFDANSADEAFYGGLGVDALQLNGIETDTSLDITENVDGSINAAFGDTATGVAQAYFTEAVLFRSGGGADIVTISGAFTIPSISGPSFVVDGRGGADAISAAGLTPKRDVQFIGGGGDDTLIGGIGNDFLIGQDDDDSLIGGMGFDTLSGGDGADILVGEDGNDELFGGGDGDHLSGGFGSDTLAGGEGDDYLEGGNGTDELYGGSGADTLDGGPGSDLLTGNAGNDYVDGGISADTVLGGDGNDTVLGGDGNDNISGTRGFDEVYGGAGSDTAVGGNDDDLVHGDDGDDLVAGTLGNDTVHGDAGNDTVLGGDGNDLLFGGTENDELYGGNGTDTLNGGTGDDLLAGSNGNDLLNGEGGNDTLFGGAGLDTLNGGDGADQLFGNVDNDELYGDAGNDTLNGGGGDDRFEYAMGDGADVINGFAAGAASDDVIFISGFGAAFDEFADILANASDDGTDTTITLGAGSITLSNTLVVDLHEDDFLFG